MEPSFLNAFSAVKAPALRQGFFKMMVHPAARGPPFETGSQGKPWTLPVVKGGSIWGLNLGACATHTLKQPAASCKQRR